MAVVTEYPPLRAAEDQCARYTLGKARFAATRTHWYTPVDGEFMVH